MSFHRFKYLESVYFIADSFQISPYVRQSLNVIFIPLGIMTVSEETT